MEYRRLTEKEKEICRRNVELFDAMFVFCRQRCANPYCEYPMNGLVDGFNSLNFDGKICGLCHAMESALLFRPGLKAAQEAYKKEQDHKKKMLDDKRYF